MGIVKTKEKLIIRGTIAVRQYKKGTLERAMPWIRQLHKLDQNSKEAKNIRKEISKILEAGIVREIKQKNLIMQAANYGMDLIIQRLNGFLVTPVYDLAINYIAIGAGQTTPSNSDTQLGNETARAVVIYSQDVNYNELQLQAFFPDNNLPNGTYYEAGAFIGGSASANSGQMFDRALFGTPYTKTSGVDTTVEIDINL